ncbi:hypothetical protein EXIGLDRAFT_605716 [Exidia glandulosa HHB12029]|uniref:lytic cellulose monooxygenase (C4-dehydrogenating) n=1 Tax=Exidia glandulosa HHB12029 TaxID=1314781 RepID=A0A165MMD9_EXIGL|nr:hypothetical protein EXIGLDRAFT_605716 [Exidia glandulosa HHB12029]
MTARASSLTSSSDTFPNFIVNSTTTAEWQYVRITENHYSNGPVVDMSSTAFRCNELDSTVAANTSIATVAAGSTVGFKADNTMGHPGYFSAYMSKASPAANSMSAATGKTWFKIWEWAPKWTASTGLIFDSENISQFTFTIPKNTPSGQYLLRGEQIALHLASTFQGAQTYLACAQINVVNGGSGNPGPLVSFPGVYTGNEPGILINIYSLPAGYSGYTSRKSRARPNYSALLSALNSRSSCVAGLI